MEYVINYLTTYFDNWQTKFFWLMVLFFCILDRAKAVWKRRNYIKLWLKEHNIGKKYR